MAPMPITCQANSGLTILWQSLNLSTFELLLPFLRHQENSGNGESILLVAVLLDVINACLVQTISISTNDSLSQSILLATICRSDSFSQILADLVKQGFGIVDYAQNNAKKFTEKEETKIVCAFLSLRIISACSASNPAAAVAMLNADLLDILVKASLLARDVLDLTGTSGVMTTDLSILRMRVSASALSTLAAFWKTARTTNPSESGDAGSLLIKLTDGNSSFVTALTRIVSDYANADSLEERLSSEAERGRVSMVSFMTSALEIMRLDLVHKLSKPNGGTVASDLLEGFAQSSPFLKFETFDFSATSTSAFCNAAIYIEKVDPISILYSFPAISSSMLSKDFYANENMFDLASALQWLDDLHVMETPNDGSLGEKLSKFSVSHSLVLCDLRVMEAWRKFLEVVAMGVYRSNENSITGSSLDILSSMADDAVTNLKDNLKVVSISQNNALPSSAYSDVLLMTGTLCDILLFLLELGAFSLLPRQDLIHRLNLLTDAMDLLFDVACPEHTEHSTVVDNHLDVSCKLRYLTMYCIFARLIPSLNRFVCERSLAQNSEASLAVPSLSVV
jgi:hypothetical protein